MSAADEATEPSTLTCYPLQRHYGVRAWITFETAPDPRETKD